MAVVDETIDYGVINGAMDAISGTKLYADLKSDYDNRLIEKETYIALLTSFHEKALEMAFGLSEKVILSGGNLKAKSAAELEKTKAETDLVVNETLTEEQKKKSYTKDTELKAKQIITEESRKELLDKQRIGFDDNITKERYKASAEVIGMIMSGGNTAPQELWTDLSSAMARMALVESRHEEG